MTGDLDGKPAAIRFRNRDELSLWVELVSRAFGAGGPDVESALEAAIVVADKVVVELRERSADLPATVALVQPPTVARQPSAQPEPDERVTWGPNGR